MLTVLLSIIDNPEDKALLEKVYLANVDKMKIIAFKILKNNEDAEDAVFDVFRSVAENMGALSLKLKDEIQWSNYLCMSTHNRALNITRSESRQKLIQDKARQKLELFTDDFIEQIEAENNIEHIKNAIKSLDEQYRLVIYQRFILDLSPGEIAKLNGLKKATVTQQITRGKKKLIQLLKGEQND